MDESITPQPTLTFTRGELREALLELEHLRRAAGKKQCLVALTLPLEHVAEDHTEYVWSLLIK